MDEIQLATLVKRTCACLDPEHLQTCQLTQKNNVYSLGVVLLELLIAKRVIYFKALGEERNISSSDISVLKEKCKLDISDDLSKE